MTSWLDAVAKRIPPIPDTELSLHERDRRHLLRLVGKLKAALRECREALFFADGDHSPLQRVDEAIAACDAATPPEGKEPKG